MKAFKKWVTNLLCIVPALMVVFLSALPFRVLYFLSDVLFVLMWVVVPYRKRETLDNLKKAFPGNSPSENQKIAREFYKHLADIIMEAVAVLTVSKRSIARRIMLDPESKILLERYYLEKKSAIMTLGHYGNWEWMGAGINLAHPGQLVAAYKRLHIDVFDELLFRARMRFYNMLVTSEQLFRKMAAMKSEGKPAVFALLADQWPPPGTAYWMDFMGRDTPFFTGPEKLSKKLNMPVLFCSIRKQKRGFYQINVQTITENPQSEPDQEITRKYAMLLEEEIKKTPQHWLWSHRRWKWQRPATEKTAC
ncbi:MAG TPA: lysophospholipid acyltransferase family protein [Bacteroidales bacterium]|nr:lysophospholipid acyltransferase family protein [Bacteroidales bacterium]